VLDRYEQLHVLAVMSAQHHDSDGGAAAEDAKIQGHENDIRGHECDMHASHRQHSSVA
jgi:hypothetical protein